MENDNSIFLWGKYGKNFSDKVVVVFFTVQWFDDNFVIPKSEDI